MHPHPAAARICLPCYHKHWELLSYTWHGDAKLLTYPAFPVCAPRFAWLLWLCSMDHCQRGQTEECDPPTTILRVLKPDQKSVCKRWVQCLDGSSSLFLVWGKSLTLVLCGLVSDTWASGVLLILTSVLGNVMEQWHHTARISPSQQGVGKGSSCSTNLFSCSKGDLPCGWWKGCRCVCLHSSEASDTVTYSILLEKLSADGRDGNTLHWLKNWLCGCAQGGCEWICTQRAARHDWCSPGLSTGASPFHILCNDLDEGTECILIKLIDNTKWGRSADLLWSRNAEGPRHAGLKCQLCEVQQGELSGLWCVILFLAWCAGSCALLIWISLSMEAWDRLSDSLAWVWYLLLLLCTI